MQRAAEGSTPSIYALPALLFLLHVAEELTGGFPAWATVHFGTTTTPWFVYSHIPLITALLVVAWRASRPDASPAATLLAVATQWGTTWNGVFHLATTLLFREYSPGVITAVLLFVPALIVVARRASRDDRLTPRQQALAAALGFGGNALAVGSLWLEMSWTWSGPA
jgi:hypothetical protein